MFSKRRTSILTKIYNRLPLDLDEIADKYVDEYRPRVERYIADTVGLAHDACKMAKTFCLKARRQPSSTLDHGTYPFVTSSNPTAGGACTGAGIGPATSGRILGVAKAYVTRVGAGPFPTELDGELGDLIVERGHEYGTNTGRKRRPGWFDAVLLRHAARLNTLTELGITKLDILDTMDTVKVCVGYEINGQEVQPRALSPERVLQSEAGIRGAAGLDGRHVGCHRSGKTCRLRRKTFISSSKAQVRVPVTLVGVGPSRDQYLRPAA